MMISSVAGTEPSTSILRRIRDGQVGGIILFGDNTAGGIGATRKLVDKLQAAVPAGQPRLLIMTDEEGGEVQRLPTALGPMPPAAQMTTPQIALKWGKAAGVALAEAGVNVDLAPVADVARDPAGFINKQERSFGPVYQQVAENACEFAQGLSDEHVEYTLKHFPGLGSAIDNTDLGPSQVTESRTGLREDEAAYRKCANPTKGVGLVMVSNASYSHLTGTVPAVLDPKIYTNELPEVVGFRGVTISDDLEAGALTNQTGPAKQAINAGLDLLLYAGTEADSITAYQKLLAEAYAGAVINKNITLADAKILALKESLGLAG
jgi:beta-N-acetylhexosaminidase